MPLSDFMSYADDLGLFSDPRVQAVVGQNPLLSDFNALNALRSGDIQLGPGGRIQPRQDPLANVGQVQTPEQAPQREEALPRGFDLGALTGAPMDLRAPTGPAQRLTSPAQLQGGVPQVSQGQPEGLSQDLQGILPQQRQAPDLSGRVREPGFGELWPWAFLGKDAVLLQKQKLINERVLPVAQALNQRFNEYLNAGDYDRASQAVLGMTNISGRVPAFARQADAMNAELNRRKGNLEANTAMADFIQDRAEGDSRMTLGAQYLKSKATVLSPDQFSKLAEKLMPVIKDENGWTSLVDQFTGEKKITPSPTMMSMKDLTKEQIEQYQMAGVDPAAVIDTRNRISAGKGNWKDFNEYMQSQQLIRDRLGQDYLNRLLPPSLQLQYGIERPQAQQILGMPGQAPQGGGINMGALEPQQKQTLAVANGVAKTFQFSPQESLAWHGILAQESSLGKNLVGDGGKSLGPGQIQQGALDDFNKKYGSNVTMQDLQRNPELAMHVSAGYFKLKLDEAKGDVGKAIVAYNGGGDKQYLQNVNQRIQELTGRQAPGLSPVQQGVQTKLAIETEQKRRETEASEIAKTATEPQKSEHFYFKMDKSGQTVGATARTSEAEKIAGGYASLPYAAGLPLTQAYNGALTSINEAITQLEKTPSLSIPAQAREVIGRAFAAGVSLPVLGKLFTTLPLSQEQRDTLTKLALANSAVQQYYKTAGVDSAEMGAIRDQMTGILSERETSHKALTELKSGVIGRMSSLMKTLNPNSVQDYVPEKSTPPVSEKFEMNLKGSPGQPGVVETIENVKSKLLKFLDPNNPSTTVNVPIEGFIQGVKEFFQQNLAGRPQTPQAPTGMSPGEAISAFVKRLTTSGTAQREVSGMTPTEAIQAFWKMLTDPNYRQQNKTTYPSMYDAVTPSWGKKSEKKPTEPINPGTMKSLTGFQ